MSLTLRLSRLELRLHWPWLLLTALAVWAFTDLGRWQWHRAAEKRLLQESFVAGSNSYQSLDSRPLATLPRYTQVEVHGIYDTAHQFLLDNMSHAGRAGYEVLTPLQLDDGRWLLVNRGWVPLVNQGRAQRPDVGIDVPAGPTTATPAGESASTPPALNVRGRIDELPVTGIAMGRVPATAESAWPRLTSFPQTADLSAALGRPLEARQLLLASDQDFGYLRDWQPGSASFGPPRHIAYAVQWWSLAGLAAALYLYMNSRRLGT